MWLDYNNFDYSACSSLKDLVKFQKVKGYFGGSEANYYAGALYHYNNNLGLIKNFFFVINVIFIPTIFLVIWKRRQILRTFQRIIKR